ACTYLAPLWLVWTRHPDDVRSFPTRRSSDLADFKRRSGDVDVHRAFREYDHTVTVADPLSEITSPLAIHVRLPRDQPKHVRIDADRKSTRLNSSHLGISYAVFCLKKKIKDNS